MADSTADFGALLRRLRVGRGLSLGRLAQLVYYSKGHLSNVEQSEAFTSAVMGFLGSF